MDVDYRKIAQILDDFLQKHSGSKNLVLGENHSHEHEHLKLLGDPHVVSVLHKHGMTTTAIESPSVFQDHVNNLMFGETTPKAFIEAITQDLVTAGIPRDDIRDSALKTYMNHAEFIPNLTKLGGHIIYFDEPSLSLSELNKQLEKAAQYENKTDQLAGREWRKLLKETRDTEFRAPGEDKNRMKGWSAGDSRINAPEVKPVYDKFLDTRISPAAEQERADYIKDHSAQGAVILAGHEHGAQFGDLDEYAKAARLSVVPDMSLFQYRSQRDFNAGKEPPEGYLILGEAKIISGDDAYKAAQEFDNKLRQFLDGPQPEAPEQKQERTPGNTATLKM